MSVEAKQTAVSSAASIGIRSPSPFVRPSSPQSQFLESSCEASVAAPTIPKGILSPSRTPGACRRRPALAQITNTPSSVQTTPSRPPVKAGRVQGVLYGVPTPPTSVRPMLAKHGSRFPLIASTTRLKDESDSPTRPARHCVSLHFSDCIFTVLILFSASSFQVPSMKRLRRYFSARTEMTRKWSHIPTTSPRCDPRNDQRCIGADGL